MAIPIGKTAGHVAFLARWMLVGVLAFGMLIWWWPGNRTWGALAAGLMLVFALWLMWRMVSGDRTVEGNWIYVALLGPAAILTHHLVDTGLGTSPAYARGLAGGMNVSMLFHLALAAIGILLSGSLLSRGGHSAVILATCGAAMIGGPAAAMAWQHAETRPIHGALTMLGLAGAGLWLTTMWSLGGEETDEIPPPRHQRQLKAGFMIVAAAAVGLLTWCRPRDAAAAGAVAAVVLILAGLILPARRKAVLGWGLVVAVYTGVLALVAHPELPPLDNRGSGLFGRGEQVAAVVFADDNGVAIIAATIGWVGLGWLLGIAALCLVGMLIAARRTTGAQQARAAAWAAATAVASCALLAPGGLSVPAITLGVALMWGGFPAIAGSRPRGRPGVLLLAAMAAILAAMGLARNAGLAQWLTVAFGGSRDFLHVPVGFFLAMVLAWLMGARRLWLGMLGILLAAAAGGAGEALQYLASRRGAEMQDWAYHAAGAAAAIVPYLLCMGSRLYESPDAVDIKGAERDAYEFRQR